MEYPLYDRLITKVKNRKHSSIDVRRVCSTINSISRNMEKDEAIGHYEEILALMFHHEKLASKIISGVTPFESKVMVKGKGVLVTMDKLPYLLQQIIAQYIEDMAQ